MANSQLDLMIDSIKAEASQLSAEPFWDKYFKANIDLKMSSEFTVLEFIKFDGKVFINKAFLELLGRAPSPAETNNLSHQLDSILESKLALLRNILTSREFAAKQKLVKINGLTAIPNYHWNFISNISSRKVFFMVLVTYIFGYLSWGDFKYLFRQYRLGDVSRDELAYNLAFVYKVTPKTRKQRILAFGIRKGFRILLNLLPSSWLFRESVSQKFLIDLLIQQELSRQGERLSLQEDLTKEIHARMRMKSPEFVSEKQKGISVISNQAPKQSNIEVDRKYFEFEARFRGSEDLVRSRLESYLEMVTPILSGATAGPALDIGFGRGEWLQLITDKGWAIQGVDSNIVLVQRMKDQGHQVLCADAVAYLEECGPESFSLITAFHVVEHIPIEGIHLLIQAAHRALKPGGMLIFETPNPENILIGSFEFWMDPTHIKPIPAPVLSFFVESYGFQNVQVIKKNPYNLLNTDGIDHPALANIIYRFNLERDYAVVALK